MHHPQPPPPPQQQPPADMDAVAAANDEGVYDVLGVGYGPANLALSIALREELEARGSALRGGAPACAGAASVGQLRASAASGIAPTPVRAVFLERSGSFAWHTSLLLPGAQLQVSPLKDMATMRNPASTFSFTAYLFAHGRLAASINRENGIPSRREWSAYLAWCALRMQNECPHTVRFGEEVLAIAPASTLTQHDAATTTTAAAPRRPQLYAVTTRRASDGRVRVLRARNVALAVGGVPHVPDFVRDAYRSQWAAQAHQHQHQHQLALKHADKPHRIVHSAHFLPSLAKLQPALDARAAAAAAAGPLRLGVVGAGQSAAEMAAHLRRRFPAAHVHLLFRAPALQPSDDSAFVNAAAFDPESTGRFWRARAQTRRAWRDAFRRTNYAVVRANVLNELFDAQYDETIELPAPVDGADGPPEGQLRIRANTAVLAVAVEAAALSVTLKDTLEPHQRTERFDALFLGTGFRRELSALECVRPLADVYPAALPPAQQHTALGAEHDDEEEPADGDASARAERTRERQRGITRSYRLVSRAEIDALRAADADNSASAAASRRAGDTAVDESDDFASAGADIDDAQPPSRSSSQSSSATLHSRVPSPAARSPALAPDDKRLADADADAAAPQHGAVYVMGCNEATHGLSDSLLSVSAHRAGEIALSLLPALLGAPDAASSASAPPRLAAVTPSTAPHFFAPVSHAQRTRGQDSAVIADEETRKSRKPRAAAAAAVRSDRVDGDLAGRLAQKVQHLYLHGDPARRADGAVTE